MYCTFCQQHYLISKTLARLVQVHPCFALFINRLRSDALRGVPRALLVALGSDTGKDAPSLESALIQPIQRIPR